MAAIMIGSSLLSLAPATSAALSYGDYGSFLDDTSDDDFVASLTEPGTADLCVGYVNDPDNPSDNGKRAWFFHVDSDGACDDSSVESSRSFRYTAFGGSKDTGWMTSSDTKYVGKSFDLLQDIDANGNVCYSEADGMPNYSPGDPIYYDADGDSDLSEHDFRFAAVSSSVLAPFSTSLGIVKSGDTDLKTAEDDSDDPTKRPIAEDFTGNSGGCGNFDAKVLDLGAQSSFSTDDGYYLTHSSLPTSSFGADGILRLTDSVNKNAGEKVQDGNDDHDDFLESVTSSELDFVRTNPSESDVAKQNLYLHFPNPGSSDDDILMHDIVVRKDASSASSAGNPGTLVTSTSNGASAEIQDSTDYAVANLVYYIDLDSDSTWDPQASPPEPVYMKHPNNGVPGGGDSDCHGGSPTGSQRCLQVNDLRLWVDGETAGTLVASGDDDYNAHKDENGQTGASVDMYRENLDGRTPVKSVSTAKYLDSDQDSVWDTGEKVYLGAVTNDSNDKTYTQIWDGSSADNTDFKCPQDAGTYPCGGSNLKSTSNVRTTGPDSTYDESAESEYVYWSEDDKLTIGDYRMGELGGLTGGQVANGDSALDVTYGQSSGTAIYASFSSASFPSAKEIELYPDFGNRLTSSDSEVVPDLSQITLTNLELVRANLGDSGSFKDDTYLLDFSDGSCTASQTLRATPHSSGAAGTFLTADDTTLTNSCQNAGSSDKDTDLSNAFGYVEEGGTSGFSIDDLVYINNADIGGTAGTTMTQWDARAVDVDFSGSTYEAGSLVKTGDTDLQSFSGDSFDGTTFGLWHYDADLDGNIDKDDMVYLRQGSAADTVPNFLDIRLIGSGGASGDGGSDSGSGGGGGGSDGGGDDGTTASPPSLSVSEPAEGANVTEGTDLTIAGSASDEGSITSVTVLVDGEDVDVTGTASWSATWPAEGLGEHNIRVTATDNDGETTTVRRTVNVVEDVPQGPTLTIDTPSEGDTVSQGAQVTISGTASEGDAALSSLNLRVDGKSVNVRGLSEWSGTWTPQSTGEATIEVTATDLDGETGTASINVNVQAADPPSVTIEEPEDGAELAAGEPTNVTGSVTPGGADIASVTVTVDGESLDVSGLEDFSAQYTPTESGTFNVTATATDEAGLTGSDQVTVTVSGEDTPAPGAAIVASLLAGMAVLVRRRQS